MQSPEKHSLMSIFALQSVNLSYAYLRARSSRVPRIFTGFVMLLQHQDRAGTLCCDGQVSNSVCCDSPLRYRKYSAWSGGMARFRPRDPDRGTRKRACDPVGSDGP